MAELGRTCCLADQENSVDAFYRYALISREPVHNEFATGRSATEFVFKFSRCFVDLLKTTASIDLLHDPIDDNQVIQLRPLLPIMFDVLGRSEDGFLNWQLCNRLISEIQWESSRAIGDIAQLSDQNNSKRTSARTSAGANPVRPKKAPELEAVLKAITRNAKKGISEIETLREIINEKHPNSSEPESKAQTLARRIRRYRASFSRL
jgi:hypothetical protein